MNLSDLAKPFPPEDVEWRVQQAGEKNGKPWARVLAYIANRAVMDRLDEVCGPGNWRNEYRHGPDGAVLCGISIYIPREFGIPADWWVTKWDGAENTDIEAVKGGLSSAMKRAGYQWGIGRYLYRLEEGFANIHAGGANYTKPKSGEAFKWDPPELPAWALPEGGGRPEVKKRAAKAPASPVQRPAEASTATDHAEALKSAMEPNAGAPEDRRFKGRRLGDLSKDELKKIRQWAFKQGNPDLKDFVQDVVKTIAGKSLGMDDDAQVARMKAEEETTQNGLPFA